MRILMVNWAPIRTGASLGGGANGYLHDLALALRERGHQVASLCSGLIHIPGTDGKQGACRVRRTDDYQGVQSYEIINSPVLAWSLHQFRHPLPEISSPELEAEFSRFVRLWKPEIVHFHNIEGLTSMCPAIARAGGEGWHGAKVVYSLHNYHTICPQVFLMHGGRTPCTHFDNGHRCVSCFDAPHTHIVLADRLRESARAAGREDVFHQTPVPQGIKERLTWKPAPVPGIPLPGRSVEDPQDIADPSLEAGTRMPTASVPVTVEGGPLSNDITPEPRSELEPNDYALRRRAMIQMLNGCDRVLAVSDFVARKFESMGVRKDKLRTMLIGSRMPEIVALARSSGAFLDLARDSAGEARSCPLRLAFLGYHNFYKGLHVVCSALEQLPEATRAQIDLAVHAKDVNPIKARLRRLSLSMGRVVVEEGYAPEEVPILLRNVDLGLVPSVWWDNGPQTVLEFLSCGVPVLASNVGGVPDVIEHERNGLLVPGNDPTALAQQIERLVENPQLAAKLRKGITPVKSMRDHAPEIEAVYEQCRRAGD